MLNKWYHYRPQVLLNEFNFNKGLLDPLRCHYLNPITALLYPTWGGGCLDSHKAFTVTYKIDHDLDLAPQAISFSQFSDGTRCNETCENTNPCFPIPVPNSDQRIHTHTCLGFTRSSSTCNTGSTSLFFNTVRTCCYWQWFLKKTEKKTAVVVVVDRLLATSNTSHSIQNFNYLLQFHLWNIPSVSVRSISTLYSSKTVTSSSDIRAFVTTRVNTNIFSERSFSYAGPAVWNNLPQTLRPL